MDVSVVNQGIIIYVIPVFVMIIFWGGYLKAIKESKLCVEMPISYTRMVKGMMAILIAFHHYSIRMQGINGGRIFTNLGFLGVAGFLAVSGYAETFQFQKKGNSFTEHYLSNKLLRIYLPWLLVNIVYSCLFWHLQSPIRIMQAVVMFRVSYRENSYNWFVIYIFFIYILLWAMAKWRQRRNLTKRFYLITLFIASLMWFVITHQLRLGTNWYINSFSFFLGALFQTVYSHRKFDALFLKKLKVGMALFSSLMILVCMYLNTNMGCINKLLKMGIAFFSCIAVFSCSHSRLSKCDILGFVGDISFEVYLLATPIFIWSYSSMQIDTNVGLLCSFIVTIGLSFLLHMLSNKISLRVRRLVSGRNSD
jgi:peptidoglycan/LPS O-acetylase OafA/YrhL